ncbi:MAG TPA: YCF48-related protein, partial [Candidatus Kapabacteria bacterium]|nr:YCF48-related protein [Candidatus Kapabacteria bacterium]
GKTWEKNIIPKNDRNFPGVFQFIDTLRGYGVAYSTGSNTTFVSTTDGGTTWTPFQTPLMANDSGWRTIWTVDKSGTLSAIDYYSYPPNSTLPLNLILYGVTSDNGATWVRDSTYPFSFEDLYHINDIECFGHGVAGITGPGLIVTTDSGKTWSHNSFCKAGITSLFFKDRNAGFALSENLYKTYNAGRDWNAVSEVTLPTYANRYSSFRNMNSIWVCGGTTAYRSVDSGKTFQPASLPPDSLLTAIDFVDSLYGWALGSFNGIWKTTDGGATWVSQRKELPFDPNNSGGIFFGESMIDSSYGWAGENVFLRTTNGGTTWDTIPTPSNLQLEVILGMQFVTRTHGFIYGEGLTDETTDGGASWNNLTDGGPGLHFRDSLFGWRYWNVTTDGGKTWISRSCATDLSGNWNTVAWWADTTEGWIAGGNYLFHYGSFDSVQVGVAEPPPPPLTTSLISNYPNPFSTTTNIELQLPTDQPATLKIYNMLGTEVADLTPQLHGQSTIEFNAAGLQPGVYFCKGVSGARECTSKLVVVK